MTLARQQVTVGTGAAIHPTFLRVGPWALSIVVAALFGLSFATSYAALYDYAHQLQFLIYLQHMKAYEQGRVPATEPTYVAGFRQWQRLGRCVVKGQSGYMIRSPVTARFASTDRSDPKSWRRLDRGESPGRASRSASR